MKTNQISFIDEALRFIKYGSDLGWHERNAGNVSLRLSESQISEVVSDFVYTDEWKKLPISISNMASEFIFTTVSGTYFIDMYNEPLSKFCICEISEDGSSYRIVWGGKNPTSELCGHLLSLSVLKEREKGRAVYHSHPANAVAISYILPQNDKNFSEMIWECETECAFVLPDGIGVLGFYVPGSFELAQATAEKLLDYTAVLWSFHGVFATGESIAGAFGLTHAIEKACEIRLKIISSGAKVLNTINKSEQNLTASTYGMTLRNFS